MEPVPPDGYDAFKHPKSAGLSVMLKYVFEIQSQPGLEYYKKSDDAMSWNPGTTVTDQCPFD
jgi:hypothetical protein